MKRILTTFLLALPLTSTAGASENDAITISRTIQERHFLHSMLLDPVFESANSDKIVSFTHSGDSAIWMGHYLAAEAFRYKVAGSPEALDHINKTLAGIRILIEVTGNNLLSRCAVPADSPFANDITEPERESHGVFEAKYKGADYLWIGGTSRDQYSGIFFGLGVAYDMVENQPVREEVRDLVTRLLDYLLSKSWFVVMPNGRISTVFVGHPDQRLSFLAVGRRVNPAKFEAEYKSERSRSSKLVSAPIAFDVLDDHSSYSKFNLNTINLFNLIRLEDKFCPRRRYKGAYKILRRTTDDHGNAHFNMIDRALKGPDSKRDAATVEMLEQWLKRPRRDERVDWRGNPKYPACGPDKACNPIDIIDRVRTDFLWQRSPFLLFGGGGSTIETPGIDYILPYWMARFYGVIK
jgi:hypothetical protein